MSLTTDLITKERFDSLEEFYFYCYLYELFEAGYVADFMYHDRTWRLSGDVNFLKITKKQLKTREKMETGTLKLLNGHTYTPDFVITWQPKAEGIFYDVLKPIISGNESRAMFVATEGQMSLIDVKGAHAGRLSSSSTFPLNQKWMYEKHKLYVQKIIPVTMTKKGTSRVYSGLFPSTFTPKRYLLTDGGEKTRVIHYKPKSLQEYAEFRAKEKGGLL